ncbi:LAGLIDADG family homing endonuclease [Inediibacterium massiliense]|uniref:LAGLIDADG family homing endonuclease n=1 Tax=Inediibacterium massiliense TaxID=1658111 RepID=UPI0006B6084C|nr:LAGLIDADG family homing endonuclease [Inediibacterium massiliense]
MLDCEKSYIAGIIDGEGSIMLIKFHKNQFPSPCITIASTTLNLLQWIQEKSKVGHIKSKKNYNPQKHKDSYTYIAKYEDAIYLLKAIEPYLIIPEKKLKARMIIYEYKQVTPRNGKYSQELLEQKEDFYKRFVSI